MNDNTDILKLHTCTK